MIGSAPDGSHLLVVPVGSNDVGAPSYVGMWEGFPHFRRPEEILNEVLLGYHTAQDLIHTFACPDDDGTLPCGTKKAAARCGFPNEITCLVCKDWVKSMLVMAQTHALHTLGRLMVG